MNWRTKAWMQNIAAALPSSFSYGMYYWLQRSFGGLRRVNPLQDFRDGIKLAEIIDSLKKSPVGCTFFELGTGRRINLPLVYWLFGAQKTISVDLNPYLKEPLIREDLEYVRKNREQIRELFAGRIHGRRLEELMAFTDGKWRLADLLNFCGIVYLSPCDASRLPLASDTVDFYTSQVVLQHIPLEILKKIFAEGRRVVKNHGIFIHHIDYSDHFAHADNTISLINFLQFSEAQWNKLAGNRYMYMNRLRQDDYCELFHTMHQKVLLLCNSNVNPRVHELLEKGELKLAERFAKKPKNILEITSSWIVSENNCE